MLVQGLVLNECSISELLLTVSCICTRKADTVQGSLGNIFLSKTGSLLKGRLICVLIQQGLSQKRGINILELIFSSVNFHFPE